MTGELSSYAERGDALLEHYDPDERDRLFRVLVDLAGWAEENRVPDFAGVANRALHTYRERARAARRTGRL